MYNIKALLCWGQGLDPKAASGFLQKQGLLTNVMQEHGQRQDWNKKRTDTEQAARHRIQTQVEPIRAWLETIKRRETGNETGTSKQNRKHSRS